MGKLEQQFERAKSLSPERRKRLEKEIDHFFSREECPDITHEQLMELKRRMAMPDKTYVEQEVIEKMLGRKFNN